MASKPPVLLVVLALLVMGCGPTALVPIDGGYSGEKGDDGVLLRLSQSGLDSLNQRWPLILDALAPGGRLTLPVACTKQGFTVPGLGSTDVFIADQGGPQGGQSDGLCDERDVPASVEVTVTRLSLVARPPDQVELALSLTMDTGKIYVTNPHAVLGVECDLKCSLGFASATAAPLDNTVSVDVRLLIDAAWDRLLSFRIDRIDGTQVCGATGALAPPACLDPTDLSMSDEGSCLVFGWACQLLDIDVIKTFVLQQLSPSLEAGLTALLTAQRCRPCGAGLSSCPSSTDGSGTESICSGGVCTDPRGGCVPRFLGVEGRVGLGGGGASEVDLSMAAGSTIVVDGGLLVGTRAGVEPQGRATCVPEVPAPELSKTRVPDFDREAAPGQRYDVAVSASGPLLDRALWAVHQSGGLCLAVDSSSFSALTTGLFKAVLPSLGPLAVRDGKDAPMMLLLRPERAPRVTVEQGGVDPMSGQPRAALTVALVDLSIDFYALVDDRMVRVATVTSDVSAPIALSFEGCDGVRPSVGALGVANVRTTNAELLAEDSQGLAGLVPSMLAVAQPAIAQALGSFALPRVGGLRLMPLEVKGLGLSETTQKYELMGFYGRLILPDDPSCAP